MRVCSIDFSKRSNGFHYFRGHKIEAVRVGNGVGVLVTFKLSQLDEDFKIALHSDEIGLWCPSQDELDKIQCFLNESDHQTAMQFNKQEWGGRRPYKSGR